MINIFIKSLNRPLFLDRCIKTILMNVQGYEKIIILDDGTPSKYLDKLKLKYDFIEIRKSEFYTEKSQMIEKNQIDKSKFKFPGRFWGEEIGSSNTEYNLIIEDDMFFKESVNLHNTVRLMQENQLVFYKLFWGQNENLNTGKIIWQGNDMQIIKPSLISENPLFFRIIVENKFKHLSFLSLLGLYRFYYINFALKYYSFYIVAGAIFKRDYFKYIWADISKLDEREQMAKSLEFYNNQKIELKIGKSNNEVIKQSFLSSATNECPHSKLSIFEFNAFMNQAWYNDEVDIMHRFPKDYPVEMIEKILNKRTGENMAFQEWRKWFEWTKSGYEKIGQKFD